jgi:hypothetical protein
MTAGRALDFQRKLEPGRAAGRPYLTVASTLLSRFAPVEPISRRKTAAFCALGFLHVAALAVMVATEVDLVGKAAYLLVWGLLNFLWLALFRRPVASALISLIFIVVLVLLSQFKHDKLWMTVDFVDLMIIDKDTSAFLLTALPSLRLPIGLLATTAVALLVLVWRLDPLRVRIRTIAISSTLCMGSIVSLSLCFPTGLYEDFLGQNYVSKFARTGVEAVREFVGHGYLESDASATENLKGISGAACSPSRKLPHIILLHDESSFDVTAAPGLKVPVGYHQHFQSFDGKARRLIVEGAGGPSWLTEYNVLTGLSARSYGRFATSVTRIAAGRVGRGLPLSLSSCGYKTFSLYPFYGAFLGSRAFQTTAGVEHYLDMSDLGTRSFEADSFYFDQATRIINREHGNGPLFLYVYTVANHFPWDTRLRPELTPNWKDLGNPPSIDEYVRRQIMTAHDYGALLEQLRKEFPTEHFLIIRYGDHQPEFGRHVIDPSLSEDAIARHLEASDPRYFTTYYAIDAVNFVPADLSSALDGLEAPYLPLVLQEAAGVPLDATFKEQKKILRRCNGLFYRCNDGAEARRFNRLLIEAGLIKGL